SSRRRHTRFSRDWSSDVCSSDLPLYEFAVNRAGVGIHAVDRTGRTVIYNEKMKAIEGLELEEVGDRSILELFNFDQEESTLLQRSEERRVGKECRSRERTDDERE